MTGSSYSSITNTWLQIRIKPKASAAIGAIFLFLLIPRLCGENLKEYIYLDGKAVAVETGDAGCGPYSLTESSWSFNASGGNRSVTVDGGADSGCPWTAAVETSATSWLTVTGGGNGNANVSFTVAPNTGIMRTGKINITDQLTNITITYTVNQANGCTYSLSPTSSGTLGTGGIW